MTYHWLFFNVFLQKSCAFLLQTFEATKTGSGFGHLCLTAVNAVCYSQSANGDTIQYNSEKPGNQTLPQFLENPTPPKPAAVSIPSTFQLLTNETQFQLLMEFAHFRLGKQAASTETTYRLVCCNDSDIYFLLSAELLPP